MLFTFTTAISPAPGEANVRHRSRQSLGPPRMGATAPAFSRIGLASGMDRADSARLHLVVADWSCTSLLHTREQKNGLLRSLESLARQDGPDARPHGGARVRDGARLLCSF